MRRLPQIVRLFATNVGQGGAPKATPPPPKPDLMQNVVGLSSKIVQNNEAKAVPGSGKDYKVAEYFGYNKMSYHEAEVEMERFRIPQPVAARK